MSRDEPVPLRDALSAVGKELGLPALNAFETVVALWRELAGVDVEAHARVRTLREGECTIEVDSPVWATRARYLTGELERVVNDHCGDGVVTRSRVVVAGPRNAG